MKPAPFDYVAPDTLEQAYDQLAAAGGGAMVLAGGQTLMPLLALRMSQPFVLVDLNRIASLRGVSRVDGETRIGPMTRHHEVITDPILRRALPSVVKAALHVGHPQIRNRGTFGGSIALGEPAAELPATAVALGAELELNSTRGPRRIFAEEFYEGPYATALQWDEVLTAVHIPDWAKDTVPVFREVTPRPGDFALLGLTGALSLTDGRIARAGLCWFGMGPTPTRARQLEQALIGCSPAEIDLKALAELAVAETTPFDDHHATAAYRRTVGRRLFVNAMNEALVLCPGRSDAV